MADLQEVLPSLSRAHLKRLLGELHTEVSAKPLPYRRPTNFHRTQRRFETQPPPHPGETQDTHHGTPP